MRIPSTLFVLAFAITASGAIEPLKELMVVDRLVVEDARSLPGGPWHFGTLIKELLPADASDKAVSDFVIGWLEEWMNVINVNGFSVTPRPAVKDQVICPWLNASTGLSDCSGILNMKLAPFRLMAITNRIDVRKPENAGEGRFTFAVLDGPTENPNDPNLFAKEFTVLMNYSLPVSATKDAKAWAQEWHALSALGCDATVGCEDYNKALAKITNEFTKRELMPGKPNGNPFIELHSNEFSIGSPWELRQFNLESTDRGLRMLQTTTNKTPDQSLNNSATLIQWATDNQAAILTETHVVPKNLLGGQNQESFGAELKWNLGTLPEKVRFNFSKNTCNGCHREESAQVPSIDGFYHVSPLEPAGSGRLSPWLLNTELPRRVKFIETLLATK